MRTFQKPKPNNQHRGRITAPGSLFFYLLVFGLFWISFFPFSLAPVSVQAQSENGLLVQAPDTSAFPMLSVTFKIPELLHVPAGEINSAQLRVWEGGLEVGVQSVTKQYQGVHFTLAINGGYDMDLRDVNGISNFDKLRSVLRDWVAARTFSAGDAWSLVVNEGEGIRNATTAGRWLDALNAYRPEFRKISPDLESLATAIQLAEARVVPIGVDKAVLYITPPAAVDHLERFENLTDAARRAGIKVFVWMVGDPLFLSNDQGRVLMALAAETGGDFYVFLGDETIPNPGNYLSNLGFTHELTYLSEISQTGTYPLKVRLTLNDGRFHEGESAPFYLDVCPPQAILVAPPVEVLRSLEDENTLTTGALRQDISADTHFPDQIRVNILITFPDEHPRPIVASRLYVNGSIVAINDSPPYEVLMWDLSEIKESGTQIIQVEVTDSLGLSSLTREFPVSLKVEQPEQEEQLVGPRIGLLLGGIILGSGVIMVLVWGVVRLRKMRVLQSLKELLKKQPRPDGDTLKEDMPERVFATLVRLGVLDKGWEKRSFRVNRRSLVLGIAEGEITEIKEPFHGDVLRARLSLKAGSFWLQDYGADVGIYVNYRPIGSSIVKIKPGDVIHFGNFGFRFTMIETSLPESVKIEPYEPLI